MQGVQAPRDAQVAWRGGVLSWLITGAAVSVLIAAVNIGTWVNHWYIAERFYEDRNLDPATTQGLYSDIVGLLRSGNRDLVIGFIWLGISLLCVLVAALVRRRRSLRRASSAG
jgi:hypothetical protein